MKSLMLVPPAQAEALYDAQTTAQEAPRFEDRFACLPWLDDDSAEETMPLGPILPSPVIQDHWKGQRRAA
jgi:hypothetical protein